MRARLLPNRVSVELTGAPGDTDAVLLVAAASVDEEVTRAFPTATLADVRYEVTEAGDSQVTLTWESVDPWNTDDRRRLTELLTP